MFANSSEDIGHKAEESERRVIGAHGERGRNEERGCIESVDPRSISADTPAYFDFRPPANETLDSFIRNPLNVHTTAQVVHIHEVQSI